MKRVPLVPLLAFSIVAAFAIIYVGCGDDNVASDTSILSGPGRGVTSPTSTSTTTTSITKGGRFDLFGDSAGCGDGLSISAQLTDIGKAADPANLTATATSLANFHSANSIRAACYGANWTDNATGSSVSRPGGDLGIVYASASDTDTTSCVSCQVSALTSSGPGVGNKMIKVVAMGLAALKSAGKSLPAAGSSENVLSLLPAVTGITFSKFTVQRLTDRDGHAIYLTDIEFTAASKTGAFKVYHEQLKSDNSEYKGLVTGYLPYTPTSGSGTHRGVSFVYHLESNAYKFSFRTAGNRNTASTDFFTDGIVTFSKAACGEDMHNILGYFDLDDNGGALHYAWQAGDGDGATRTFAANVPNGTAGSRTGTGWFGFGAQMTSLTASRAVPWMTKMHCNWLNQLGSGPSIAKVQKQTIKESGGKFIVETSSINFAPTNSCDAASWTVSAATGATFLEGSKSTSANDLVAPPTASDFMYDFSVAGNEPSFTIP